MSQYPLKNLFPILYFLSFSVFLNAQTKILGTISDKEGNALSGASLYIKTLELGTLSDKDGQFEMTIPKTGEYLLEISYLGMRTKSQTIEVGNTPNDLTIQLAPDPLKLESVIVTGTFNEAARLATSTASSTLSQKRYTK